MQRREVVAELLLRRLTQRQICDALAKQGIFNEETGEAYTVGTINGDVKALKRDWRARANLKAAEWLAEELAGLEALEKSAWAAKQYGVVLKIKERRAKMLGLDKPAQIKVGGEGKNGEIVFRVVYADEDQVLNDDAISDS